MREKGVEKEEEVAKEKNPAWGKLISIAGKGKSKLKSNLSKK
jgi:hypothetical protein